MYIENKRLTVILYKYLQGKQMIAKKKKKTNNNYNLVYSITC